MQIYKTTNNITGQIYIGKDTKDKPYYYGSGRIILRALKKYGKSNFTKEVIDFGYDKDHLSFLECFWIQKLPECKVENGGYNITKGGDGFTGKHSKETIRKFSKPVLQFDLNGILLKEWGSNVEAERELGLNDIYGSCSNRRKTVGGYIWILKKEYSIEVLHKKVKETQDRTSSPIPKPVLQIDRSTNEVIKEWNSGREVKAVLGISNENISAVCNRSLDSKGYGRETAGGFKWKYKDK